MTHLVPCALEMRAARHIAPRIATRGAMPGVSYRTTLAAALLASAANAVQAQPATVTKTATATTRGVAGVQLQAGTFPIGGQPVPVTLGAFSVPALRDAASGADTTTRFTLRFVRFASTARVPAPPIVFLAGGPGDAATRAFRGMPVAYLDSLRAIADVIAFDQRGTGTSEPRAPLCPPGSAHTRDRPGDAGTQVDTLRARLVRCLGRAAAAGLDVRAFTTWESADDLAALALVLDAPRLSLLAGSYGTHLALATVARHPTLVHRMVLAGVEGPDHTLKEPRQVEAVLERIAQVRRPALLTELRALRQQFTAAPATVALSDGGTVEVGGWDLERWVTDALDATPEIDAMLSAMPALLSGHLQALAAWALAARRPRPINLMNLAMDCASYASPDRLARVRAQLAGGVFGGAINTPLPDVCDVSGLPRLPDAFRAPVRSEVRALLIAGTVDGRTPVANAEEVATGLPNAELLVIPGASHSLLGHPVAMAATWRVLGAP